MMLSKELFISLFSTIMNGLTNLDHKKNS